MTHHRSLAAAARNVRIEGLENRKLFATGYITGAVYHDVDGDDYYDYSPEQYSSLHAAYLDLNENAVADTGEPVAWSTSAGFRFDGLADGSYLVRLLDSSLAAGEFPTNTAGKRITVSGGYGYSGANLGYARNGGLQGHTYEETSTTWSFSLTDKIVTGRRVYVDLNRNEQFDADEPTAITPASGQGYQISGLKPGVYTLRQVLPDGWYQASSSTSITVTSGTLVAANLGSKSVAAGTGAIQTTLFNDRDGDGVRDTFDSSLSYNSYLYLDLNNNGVRDGSDVGGYYIGSSDIVTFADLTPGTYALRFDSSSGYVQSPGTSSVLTVKAGEVTKFTFAVTQKTTDVYGVIYNDANANGVKDASESGLSGGTVFADLNDNGIYDSGEPSAYSYSSGFSLYSVPVGTWALRYTPPTGYAFTGRAGTFAAGSSFLTDGKIRVPQDLLFDGTTASFQMLYHQAASISGKVWNDANKNGTVSTGELGLEGRVVYVDADNDAVLDDNETSVLTDASGNYVLRNLPAGTYIVRAQYPTGWAQTYPTGDAAIVTIVTTGQQVTAKNYGQYEIPTKGTITGKISDDTNGDGLVAGDGGYAGATVFVDANTNGAFDSGELSAVTSADGSYAISSVPQGTWTVQLVAPSTGYITTADHYVAQVIPDNTTTGITLGVFRFATVSGTFFQDLNGDGLRQRNEQPLSGVVVRAHMDNPLAGFASDFEAVSDSTGTYVFSKVPARMIAYTLVPPAGWNVGAGRSLQFAHFGPYSGLKYFAQDIAMTQKSLIGAGTYQIVSGVWTTMPGAIFYIDANGNDQRDVGEQVGTTSATGSVFLGALDAGTYIVRMELHPDMSLLDPTMIERVVTVDGTNPVILPAVELVRAIGPAAAVLRAIEADEGGSVAISAVATRNAATTGIQWDFDYSPAAGFQIDSTATNPIVQVGTNDSAPYTLVAVRYLDSNGVAGPISAFPVTIYNVAPSAVLSPVDKPAYQGAGVSFGSIVEPSAADKAALKYSYDFDNDGTFDLVNSPLSTATLPDAMANKAGTYTVKARIADKDGGYSDYTTTVTVAPGEPPVQALVIQSETATLSGGTVKATNNAGYTGTGFADYAGQNSAVTYTFSRSSAGTSSLVFRYANGSTLNRPLQIFVNNTLVGTVACAPTGSWTTWANVTLANVSLPSGTVSIKAVASTSNGGANVDSLTVTGGGTVVVPPPPPPPTNTTGSISGVLFMDSNKNGIFDGKDYYLSGKQVFLDLDGDNVWDSNEKQVTSDASGKFSFTGLAAGTYKIRRIVPAGYKQTSPLLDVVLTAGQNVSGLKIITVTV